MEKSNNRSFFNSLANRLAAPTIAATLLGALMLGVLFGWILFAEPNNLGEAKLGNVSDIVTAVGTWVIGLAAAWFAKEAHALRKQEFSSQNKRETEFEIAKLERLRFLLEKAKFIDIPLEGIDDEAVTNHQLRRIAERIRIRAGDVTWPSELVSAMPAYMVKEHEIVTLGIKHTIEKCVRIMQIAEDDDFTLIDKGGKESLQALKQEVSETVQEIQALSNLIEKRMDALMKSI